MQQIKKLSMVGKLIPAANVPIKNTITAIGKTAIADSFILSQKSFIFSPTQSIIKNCELCQKDSGKKYKQWHFYCVIIVYERVKILV